MSQGKQQAVYEEVPVPSSALRIAALAISTALAHAEHPLPAEARTTPLHCSVRGVSGGERKRVSIAEARITRASLVAWDNSTCGLDASTALGYACSLRRLTTLQRARDHRDAQPGLRETIYEFDRVLVMDNLQGRCVDYGAVGDARAYIEGLGYYAPGRQTTADLLTGLMDLHEVQFPPGCEATVPGRPPRCRAGAQGAARR